MASIFQVCALPRCKRKKGLPIMPNKFRELNAASQTASWFTGIITLAVNLGENNLK